ncbi:MAG: prolyl oligopeptidase family protein, partial [Tepidisphaerales bacterium]
MTISRLCIIGLFLVSAGCASRPVPAPAPATEAKPVTETIGGRTFVDPYRWLEGDEQGKVTPEVAAWTDAQNAYTRSVLDNLPGRAAVEARLRELMTIPAMGVPVARGGPYFHTRREGSQNQAVLFVRQGPGGEPRLLLDPNALDKEGLVTLAWYVPSHDGKLLAFGIYRAGDENAVGHILDVDTGKWLADELKSKVSECEWSPDGKSLFYARLADAKNPYSKQICFHKLGDEATKDAVLFEQYKTGPLATTYGPEFGIDRNARWMALGYYTGTRSNDLWAVDLEKWRTTGQFERREIVTGVESRSTGIILGDTLYMQTTVDAPNGRLVAVDMKNPGRANWKVLAPERADATLKSIDAAKDFIVLHYDQNACSHIELIRRDGTPAGTVALPGLGSASLHAEEDSNEGFLSYTSFNTPPTIYRFELPAGNREVWHRVDVPVDPDSVEVKQAWYPSKDGTKISMFIVHKKGMKLDGRNPTLLYGYGGFGISMTPAFRATYFPFFEAGGVLAIPNLRGGGEYGEAWHKAGMLEKKQNVFDDFISAAGYLIQAGYTSPNKLAISGGSNGGLLVGAVLVQCP